MDRDQRLLLQQASTALFSLGYKTDAQRLDRIIHSETLSSAKYEEAFNYVNRDHPEVRADQREAFAYWYAQSTWSAVDGAWRHYLWYKSRFSDLLRSEPPGVSGT